MPIGKNREEKQEWKVGDMIIDETEEYKYLGDIISYDGKNTKNIKARKDKANAGIQVLNQIGT